VHVIQRTDSGYTGHHPTRTNKIFTLQLGNVGKELVMVVNSEEDKKKVIKCGKAGEEEGNQWLI